MPTLGRQITTTKTEDKPHDWGWSSFVVGLFLIPFSLAFIWQNEKKIVKYYKVIKKA